MVNCKIVFLVTLIFLFSCGKRKEVKETYQVSNWKQEQITTLLFDLQKRGMKNVTDTLLAFLRSKDSVIFNEYMLLQKYDSAFLIPGNIPNYIVHKYTNLKIPVGYTPEDNSLVLFKKKGSIVAFAYETDDILVLDITGREFALSTKDSNLVVHKRRFTDGEEQYIFKSKK
jgi:hypothetical protein